MGLETLLCTRVQRTLCLLMSLHCPFDPQTGCDLLHAALLSARTASVRQAVCSACSAWHPVCPLCRLQELAECFVSRYYGLTAAGRKGMAFLESLYSDQSVSCCLTQNWRAGCLPGMSILCDFLQSATATV